MSGECLNVMIPTTARLPLLTAALLAATVQAPSAFAWGERGHDLVARVAVRSLVLKHGSRRELTGALFAKEHMMGHLANVPDIVWRNADKAVTDANSPTHYVDLEFIDPKPAFANLPLSIGDMESRMGTLCAKPPAGYACPAENQQPPKASMAGTAPFRIRQLWTMMKGGFEAAARAAAKPGDEGRKEMASAVNSALLAGGIMAHFVGDLAQPLHTTVDYNGFGTGQGGSHSYFESDVVSAFDLTLDQAVLKATGDGRAPFARVEKAATGKAAGDLAGDPLATAWALAMDSFNRLPELNRLDKAHAILKASSTEKGMQIKAERRPAAAVAERFRPLVIERLSVGAAVLATLWESAWAAAGKPDLTAYQSWDYPTTPDFISPDYLSH